MWASAGHAGRRYRILALDAHGGAVMFVVRMLVRLEAASPGIVSQFELVAATSSAAPVALLLGLGYTPVEIEALLLVGIPPLLADAGPQGAVGGGVRWMRRWLWRPLHCRFTSAPRLSLFQTLFGNATMADLHRHVLITAFRVDPALQLPEEATMPMGPKGRRDSMGVSDRPGRWRPVVFSNLPTDSAGVPPDSALTLVDAAMRATATPTYCPIYQVGLHVLGSVVSSFVLCAARRTLSWE